MHIALKLSFLAILALSGSCNRKKDEGQENPDLSLSTSGDNSTAEQSDDQQTCSTEEQSIHREKVQDIVNKLDNFFNETLAFDKENSEWSSEWINNYPATTHSEDLESDQEEEKIHQAYHEKKRNHRKEIEEREKEMTERAFLLADEIINNTELYVEAFDLLPQLALSFFTIFELPVSSFETVESLAGVFAAWRLQNAISNEMGPLLFGPVNPDQVLKFMDGKIAKAVLSSEQFKKNWRLLSEMVGKIFKEHNELLHEGYTEFRAKIVDGHYVGEEGFFLKEDEMQAFKKKVQVEWSKLWKRGDIAKASHLLAYAVADAVQAVELMDQPSN